MGLDIRSLLAPGVRAIDPYVPGKPLAALAREYGVHDAIKLASNENALGPSPHAIDAARAAIAEVARYPDDAGFALKHALAAKLGVASAQLVLGNGSNDVLGLMARTFVADGDEVIYAEYSFGLYPLLARAVGAAPVPVPARDWGTDLPAMRRAITARTRLVFIANPNNPTGTWNSEDELDAFLRDAPAHVLVVIDEAYFEYVEEPEYASAIGLIQSYPNLVVTRTFSKIYGLAGLRIGYSVSSAEIAEYLNRVRQPFNVNHVAAAAALAAVADDAHVEHSVALNRDGKRQLAQGFARLGLAFIPSAANFLTVDLARPAAPVYERLLRRGVIVRPIANCGMPNHLRVTIGLPQENERFLRALPEALQA